MKVLLGSLSLLLLATPSGGYAVESVCFGTVSKGRLENGVSLPASGNNFAAYSAVGYGLGRTYVHSRVRDVVIAAYEALEAAAPGKTYVYGETGWASGGRIRPHRTHQNGLSVDFMVPVVDKAGQSVPLPTNVFNRFGYDIEFDSTGQFEDYTIDFEALGEHLYQIALAAKARDVGITLVILDPQLIPRLLETKHASFLRELNFMRKQAWVRHDEHYHVDFGVPCKPLKD